jgi:NADH dehydrogenase
MSQHTPVVVIVGGGFGGLAAARALKQAPVKVVLIDRANHHLFQPLLYQVATSVLAPGQIGSPIRGILRNSDNTTVILGNVTGIDAVSHCVVAVRNKILQAFEIAEAEEDSSRHKDLLTFV